MRALVTGVSGFVGRHLAAALHASGWQTVGFARRNALDGLPATVEMLSGDILDDRFLLGILSSQRFDAVFHLAGQNASVSAPDLYRVNAVGSAVLLQSVRMLGRLDIRVVMLGSSAQYGKSKDDPIHEESAFDPATDYGISKVCSDVMGKVLFEETGQHVLRARAFNIVGPGQSGTTLQGRVIEQVVGAECGDLPPVLKTGDLSARRDFVDVRDVAAGLIAIADAGEAGEAYNLCSGQATKAATLVDRLVSLSNVPLELEVGPRKVTGSDVPFQRGSFEKLRLRANWAPTFTLDQSLRDALDQHRINHASFRGEAAGHGLLHQ